MTFATKFRIIGSEEEVLRGILAHGAQHVLGGFLRLIRAENPLPVEEARRYVDLAGGVDHIINVAQKACDAGDFRWSAEIVKYAIYAEPNNNRQGTLRPVRSNRCVT